MGVITDEQVRGFIIIETPDEIYWYVNGREIMNHPGIEADQHHYIDNFDMVDELHNAHTAGAELPYLLGLIKA